MDDGWRVPDRGERTRDELVRAGVDVLLEQGWARLTAREVAARVGVSASLVCHHFGGTVRLRRQVATEAVRDMLRPALDVLCDRRGVADGLVTLLSHLQDETAPEPWVDDYDDLVGYGRPGPDSRHVLADLVVAAMQDAVLREVVRESLDLARERVVMWLGGLGVAEDRLDGTAVLLVALLDGLLLHRHLDASLPLEAVVAAVRGASGESPQPCSAGTTSCSNSSMPLVS